MDGRRGCAITKRNTRDGNDEHEDVTWFVFRGRCFSVRRIRRVSQYVAVISFYRIYRYVDPFRIDGTNVVSRTNDAPFA